MKPIAMPIPGGYYPNGSRNVGGHKGTKLARILKRLKAKRQEQEKAK